MPQPLIPASSGTAPGEAEQLIIIIIILIIVWWPQPIAINFQLWQKQLIIGFYQLPIQLSVQL